MKRPLGIVLLTCFYALVALVLVLSAIGHALLEVGADASILVYFALYAPMVLLGFPLGYIAMALGWNSIALAVLAAAAGLNATGIWRVRQWARVATAVHAVLNVLGLGFSFAINLTFAADMDLVVAMPLLVYGAILWYVVRWKPFQQNLAEA